MPELNQENINIPWQSEFIGLFPAAKPTQIHLTLEAWNVSSLNISLLCLMYLQEKSGFAYFSLCAPITVITTVFYVKWVNSDAQKNKGGESPSLNITLCCDTQDVVGLLSCECTLPSNIEFFIKKPTHPKSFFSGLVLIHSLPSLYLGLGLQELTLGLVELQEVHTHLSSLYRSLWSLSSNMLMAPQSCVSSANVLSARSVPLSVSPKC